MSRREELLAELKQLDAESGDKDALRQLMNVWADLMLNVLYYDRKEDDELPQGKTEELISRGFVSVNELMELVRTDLEKAVEGWEAENS